MEHHLLPYGIHVQAVCSPRFDVPYLNVRELLSPLSRTCKHAGSPVAH